MNRLGLYLHVPFCRGKCRYCDFYSLAAPERAAAYVEKVISFLPALREKTGDRPVDTVYLGGGTPSLLPPASLTALFAALRERFSILPSAEITCEANPESLTDEVLAAFRAAGVNRLSIGMQSAFDEELSILGRLHSAVDTARAVERAHRAGFENVSLDLMYALPCQSVDRFSESVKTALSYGAVHISFYCLTLSENTPLYALRDRLPDEETQREMYLSAVDLVEKAGLEQYEISNAALPGFASRHNLRYWRREEYLGVGPGAWSYLDGERFGMVPSLDRFLAAEDPFSLIDEREGVDRAGMIEEEIALSLRLSDGLSAARLSTLAGREKADAVLKKLAVLSEKGLARPTADGFRLTPEGFFVSNTILADLI